MTAEPQPVVREWPAAPDSTDDLLLGLRTRIADWWKAPIGSVAEADDAQAAIQFAIELDKKLTGGSDPPAAWTSEPAKRAAAFIRSVAALDMPPTGLSETFAAARTLRNLITEARAITGNQRAGGNANGTTTDQSY